MSELAAAAAWLLGGVLAWAAVAKLRDPDGTAATFTQLGLPAPGALGRLVPGAELATAALLVAVPALGATAAVVLLSGFTALLASVVRGGESVACGCFGSSAAEPVTGRDLLRNAALLATAVLALASPGGVPSLPAVLAVGAAAATVVMALGLLRLRDELGVVWATTLPGEAVAR